MTLDADVKGDAYEGLLAKNAEDVKSGAGQYFTPRPLIQAIVDVMRPTATMQVCDPAAGTGGFLLAAYEQMKAGPLDPDQKKFLRNEALRGCEIVDATARLCAMNLLLHGISAPESPSLITVDDALRSAPSEHFDMVLTNPPFGRKSSYKVINAQGETEREDMSYLREDFWATTSNKQLNFLQHVRSLLTINGRAAMVVPDNVLFEGGAGETIRTKLLQQCDVHTLLRLPTGIFYAGGVKANVLFFDRKPPSEKPWTQKLWIYDFRTNQHFTLKTRALVRADLDDFVACYNPANRHERTETERFKCLLLRRAARARQGIAGHLLAARRVAGRLGQPARPRGDRGRDRRGPAGCAGPIRGHRRFPRRQRGGSPGGVTSLQALVDGCVP